MQEGDKNHKRDKSIQNFHLQAGVEKKQEDSQKIEDGKK